MVRLQQGLQQTYCMEGVNRADAVLTEANALAYAQANFCPFWFFSDCYWDMQHVTFFPALAGLHLPATSQGCSLLQRHFRDCEKQDCVHPAPADNGADVCSNDNTGIVSHAPGHHAAS
jgi:hypothetical protein